MVPFTSESLTRDVRSFYLIFEHCKNKISILSIYYKGYFKDNFNICKNPHGSLLQNITSHWINYKCVLMKNRTDVFVIHTPSRRQLACQHLSVIKNGRSL